MDDNKFLAIMDKLSEVGERTARIEATQDAMNCRLGKIEDEDAKQNELLAEHIEGTIQNREAIKNETARREALANAHDKLKSRVEVLEQPASAKKWIMDNVMWLVLIASGIATVLVLFLPHK